MHGLLACEEDLEQLRAGFIRLVCGWMRRKTAVPGSVLLVVFLFVLPAAQCATRIVSQGVAPELRGQILREQVLRESADPCLGFRWRLVADPAHPGWPARMVMVDDGRHSDAYRVAAAVIPSMVPGSAGNSSSAIIYAGDPVTVDQDTGVLRARFQAVALEAAGVGQPLRVRLAVQSDRRLRANSVVTSLGPIISVVATEVGRAVWRFASSASPATDASQAVEGEQP
jgi:hypothetical protein